MEKSNKDFYLSRNRMVTNYILFCKIVFLPILTILIFFQNHAFRQCSIHIIYPSLLDAKFNGISGLIEDCFSQNLTNGLNKLLPIEFVKPDNYF
jgi:hypothetical protein